MEIALTQLDNDYDESVDTTTAGEFRCYCFLHFSVYYHPTTTPPQSLLLLLLLLLITIDRYPLMGSGDSSVVTAPDS